MTKRIVWLVAGVVVTLVAGLGFFWPFRTEPTLRLAGMVEIQEVRLGSKVSGRVNEVLVREGARVSAGQKLVTFEAPELEAIRDQMLAKFYQAMADLARISNGPREEEKRSARAAANSAKAHFEKLKKGWREEEKKEAAGNLDTAQAELKQAQAELKRLKALFDDKSISKQELDAATGAHDRAKGKVHALEARNELMIKGYRQEEIDQARADYEKMLAQAEMLEAGSRWEDIALARGRMQEAKAALDEAEARLRETIVWAPENVLIEVVAVRKGDVVPPNHPVVRALRDDDLWVKVFVPEPHLGKIELNQDAEVEVFTDSYPNQALKGKITYIDPVSEFTPRNIQSIDERRHQVFGIKVHVENGSRALKAGMAAEVRFRLRTNP